jgi:hypothetical protein
MGNASNLPETLLDDTTSFNARSKSASNAGTSDSVSRAVIVTVAWSSPSLDNVTELARDESA